MNREKLEIMKSGKGFIAALDQSGGSTPKALKLYGIGEEAYKNDEEMFKLVHEMRSRIITDPAFTSDRILGAILFKVTMNSKIGELYTPDYLWDKKRIVPILKVDEGLAEEKDGVKLMKPMKAFESLLDEASKRNIFATKMRNVIYSLNPSGIKEAVSQQFELAKRISKAGFVPIIEPEVDINSEKKSEIEDLLLEEVIQQMKSLNDNEKVMFKFTLPDKKDLFSPLCEYSQTVRIVALSGGYTREKANELLKKNRDMIASFSRALTEGLNINQTDEEFTKQLDSSIQSIYDASVKK